MIAAGGHGEAGAPAGDTLMAFALPRPGEAGPSPWLDWLDRPGGRSGCTPGWPQPRRSRWRRCGGDGGLGDIGGRTEQPRRTRAAPPAQPGAGVFHPAVVHGNGLGR